jgi:ATP-dependent protease ClpP protease subunit
MNFILYNKDIDYDNIQDLIDNILSTEDEKVYVYINSEGGDPDAASAFEYFTKVTDKDITLISNWNLSSSGLILFLRSKTKKVVLPGCYGYIHLANREVNSTSIINPDELDTYIQSTLDDFNIKYHDFLKSLGLSEEKLSLYLKGKEVLLNNNEIKELASNAQKHYGVK